ncbi:putative tyrosyl-DNA phosphodiesterase [Zalerion maritima]|uniref:Tyrosyl-DNA phosphodiesterase n=1 Tax=Zalerion maritima TaxID=339359 RepID=A0AAD5WU24_9PEZI|nr:putative tyrosyl-DNA phosphodiesterase [Zalerion maritima]
MDSPATSRDVYREESKLESKCSPRRPISPPPLKRRKLTPQQTFSTSNASRLETPSVSACTPDANTEPETSPIYCALSSKPKSTVEDKQIRFIKSPFSLTRIHDLAPSQNVDCVDLSDILCDPLIRDVWIFNYLHDIDFIMSHLDPDVKNTVKVHIVHGFWKQEDPNRLNLHETASRYENVSLHAAFMPEMFGTHHSKMFIVLRHDDAAQLIIHTANMIERDWKNMAQGVWRSPLLPLMAESSPSNSAASGSGAEYGTGERFKHDLLNYLEAYDRRRRVCKPLRDKLANYSFEGVKGALVASVPGRFRQEDGNQTTFWGLQGLSKVLSSIHIPNSESGEPREAEVVAQISSVATLGPTDAWLENQLIAALSHSHGKKSRLRTRVVFPTAAEIRRSLDGYNAGGSIHWKIQSAQQQKQLAYMKPMLHHWSNDSGDGVQSSGRNRAAPHIKTYTRYNSEGSVDWALLTSGNVSKQAWGDQKDTEIRIASWEIGVLVWPALFSTGEDEAKMIPIFLKDIPSHMDAKGIADGTTVTGLRIPYNLPLRKYGNGDIPWVATTTHTTPDWRGTRWLL